MKTVSMKGSSDGFDGAGMTRPEHYRAIVNAIPDMIIRLGRDGVFHSFEGDTDELYWPAEVYLGQRIQDVLPEETAALFLSTLEDALNSDEVQYLNYSLKFDGKLRHYEARLMHSSGDEAIAIVRNVTREKRTEDELRNYQKNLETLVASRAAELSRAESNYRSIFHLSGAPSIIVDQDFTISMANAKFSELTGYPREEIEGRMKWISFISECDRDMVEDYHFSRRTHGGKAPSEYECQIVGRDGSVKNIFIKVGLLPEPGRTIASIIDITSLKTTERRLRDREALYSAMLQGYEGLVYIVDPEYRIHFMNERLVSEIGRDASGELCYAALHNRDSRCVWCVAETVFQGHAERFEMKNPKDRKWYHSVNVPIRRADGAIFCQAMVTDIHERKQMEEALRDSEAHLREENLRLRSTIREHHQFGDIIGQSKAMQEVYELMLMAGASDANLIIYGESGTGKELVAHAIHDMSERSDKPFVPVNCGAIPENLLEREFFGHRKGAFTGADSDKAGFLDEADGGTLFLDEIGEIKQDLQVKLLRAIEGGGYTPVGGGDLRKPNFRIIAATSRNLAELVQQGMMRSDFFYRVHVIPVHLPPLRERKEDIPLLVEHFLKAYDRKIRPPVTERVLSRLMAYDWPGNVRELQNVLYRFVTLKRIDLGASGGASPTPMAAAEVPDNPAEGSLGDIVGEYESRIITAALERHRWNRTHTAKALGVGLRTLQRKMKAHGIDARQYWR
jgi:PAS domain S-box-containing protein